MKATSNYNLRKTILERVIAIFIAAIFICGSAFIPSGVYATDGTVTESTAEVQPSEPVATESQGDESESQKDETEPQKNETEADTEMEDLLVMPKNSEAEYDGYIYKIEDDTTNKEIKEMENEIDNLDSNQAVEEITKDELYVADSLDTIESVADTENIQYIEPNYKVSATEMPNDTYLEGNSWPLDMMNVPYAWDQNMFGSGVTIAVLDTGKPEHEDIDSSIFVNEENFSDSETVNDNDGHGTAVIGIIAASYNNDKGFVGVMPETKIMPIKILDDEGNGNTANIVAGINHAIECNADVINMSLGGPRGTISLRMACEEATEAGVVIVAASGNEAKETIDGIKNPVQYPAAYNCVVSVAAVDKYRKHSSFSTYNNKVTVAAPGESVCTLLKDNHYGRRNGTSFSSPQVAALAAMVKSIDSETTTSEFINILRLTSRDAGDPGYDIYYGYGIVNFANVYNYMTSNNAEIEVYLSENAYTYNGKVRMPSVTVKAGDDVLTKGEDYNLSISPGKVRVGTYNVTASAIISRTEISTFFGETTVSYKINPPLVKKIKSSLRGRNGLTVRWYSMNSIQKGNYKYSITGYQVRASRYSNFARAKYESVTGYNSTSKTIKNLDHKKKYYVQYRAYKTIGETTYYSKWSSVRTKITR